MKGLTLGENLPLGGFASRRVGKNLVELIKEVLHLASTLSFGHLVTDTKLWGSTVISTALSQRCGIKALETGDTAVLHRVVVGRGNVCE